MFVLNFKSRQNVSDGFSSAEHTADRDCSGEKRAIFATILNMSTVEPGRYKSFKPETIHWIFGFVFSGPATTQRGAMEKTNQSLPPQCQSSSKLNIYHYK